VQAVAADAQAHKRFWTGAAPTLVHGNPTCDNVISIEDHLVLTGWNRFGLGDPAYELALTVSYSIGDQVSRHVIPAYLELAGDPMVNTRVQIYQRALPFSRLVALLSAIDTPSEAWANDFIANLRSCLQTYSNTPQTIEPTLQQAQAWIAQTKPEGTQPNARAS
jgi:hypothetical protein